MPRSSSSPARRQRHKKWLKRAKGFRGRRSTVFKLAKEATLKAGQYAYRDRRARKSQMRAAWQTTINAAARQHGTTYSKLTHDLKQADIKLDRKVLAQLAQQHPAVFQAVSESASTKHK